MAETSPLSKDAHRLIDRDFVIWLSTIRRHLSPQPRPVRFIWYEEQFLIYSRPNTHKLSHIQERPNVSLNFNSDREASDDVVILKGVARLAPEISPANELSAYAVKYAEGFTSIGMTAEEFGESYSVPILIDIKA